MYAYEEGTHCSFETERSFLLKFTNRLRQRQKQRISEIAFSLLLYRPTTNCLQVVGTYYFSIHESLRMYVFGAEFAPRSDHDSYPYWLGFASFCRSRWVKFNLLMVFFSFLFRNLYGRFAIRAVN